MPPQDLGGRQNIASRNTKHLRSFWDSVPRWLHHGDAHTIREVLLGPDSPLLQPRERGFNFRTVRTDHSRVTAFDFLGGPAVRLPTEVPITFADSRDNGSCTQLAGDGRGPICVSLDSPFVRRAGADPAYDALAYPEGRLRDRSARHEQRRAAGRQRPHQPDAGGQSHPGDPGHARPNVTTVGGADRSAVDVSQVAAEIERKEGTSRTHVPLFRCFAVTQFRCTTRGRPGGVVPFLFGRRWCPYSSASIEMSTGAESRDWLNRSSAIAGGS